MLYSQTCIELNVDMLSVMLLQMLKNVRVLWLMLQADQPSLQTKGYFEGF